MARLKKATVDKSLPWSDEPSGTTTLVFMVADEEGEREITVRVRNEELYAWAMVLGDRVSERRLDPRRP